MVSAKEKRCLDTLAVVLAEYYPQDEFSVTGYKESAVCIERIDAGWEVYVGERNAHHLSHIYPSILEASIAFLREMSADEELTRMEDRFLDLIATVPEDKAA